MDAKPSFARRVLKPMVVGFFIFYLGFHAISGNNGLYALFKETRKLELIEAKLHEVKTKRQLLEHKVALLSNQSLDLDMLDEQVRRVLGMTKNDEIVYFLNDNS